MGWARAALCGVLLLQAACGRQADTTSNDAAVKAEQERTMKKATDDVDAAMAEAGMTNADAPANVTAPSEH